MPTRPIRRRRPSSRSAVRGMVRGLAPAMGTKARIQDRTVRIPRPTAPLAPSAASPARCRPRPMASASGTGLWSGSPANGSAGRTGSRWWVVAVAASSLISIASSPSEPEPPRTVNRCWRYSTAVDRPHAGQRALQLIDAHRVREVPADERDPIVGGHAALPRVRLHLERLAQRGGHASPADARVLLVDGRRRWDLVHPSVADEHRAGRPQLRDVRLAAADHDRHDADAAATRDAQPAALVIQPSVRAAQRLGQGDQDARRQVVVVVAHQSIDRLAGRLGERGAPAGQLGDDEEAALRPGQGADGGLVEDDEVEGVSRPLLGGQQADPGRDAVAHERPGCVLRAPRARLWDRPQPDDDPPIRPDRRSTMVAPGRPFIRRFTDHTSASRAQRELLRQHRVRGFHVGRPARDAASRRCAAAPRSRRRRPSPRPTPPGPGRAPAAPRHPAPCTRCSARWTAAPASSRCVTPRAPAGRPRSPRRRPAASGRVERPRVGGGDDHLAAVGQQLGQAASHDRDRAR